MEIKLSMFVIVTVFFVSFRFVFNGILVIYLEKILIYFSIFLNFIQVYLECNTHIQKRFSIHDIINCSRVIKYNDCKHIQNKIPNVINLVFIVTNNKHVDIVHGMYLNIIWKSYISKSYRLTAVIDMFGSTDWPYKIKTKENKY